MNKPILQKLTVEEKKALKEKHRIEAVMQEAGEQFTPDAACADVWRSITTKGLTVDLRRQSFELVRPSMESRRGDVIGWLMFRNGWTFPQAIRYLQSRPPDSEQVTPSKAETTAAPTLQKARRHESEFPDEEKESSGLYDCGVVWRDGKTFYSYLPKPQDRWQERALEIGGEEMRDYFGWKAWQLHGMRDAQYHRFLPVQDTWIETCDECEKEINWDWKQKPQFAYPLMPGSVVAFEKVRVYSEYQVFAWQVAIDGDDDDFIICEDCKRKHINFYVALGLLYKSASKREAPLREQEMQEAREARLKAENERLLEVERSERLWEAQECQRAQGEKESVIAGRGGRA